jgi:thymidylate synthase
MRQYIHLLKDVIKNGAESDDRTGVGTKSVFGRQMRYDLSKGFPLVTTKKTYWKGIVIELLWIMRGDTNIKFLTDRNVHIWDSWADSKGDLGPVYGAQWRDFKSSPTSKIKVDQLKQVIDIVKNNPNSRRIILSAWNPLVLDRMALPPCHSFIQFYVRDGKLSCQLYQRSADLFLGVPFNIASYALLTYLVANDAGLEVGEFVHTFGDLHLYKNHLPQCEELVKRKPIRLPDLKINLNIDDLMYFIDCQCHKMSWEEIQKVIQLDNYNSHPLLKGEVAV